MMADKSTEAVDRLTAVDQLRLHVDHELSEPDPSDLMDEVDALAAERDSLEKEVGRLREVLSSIRTGAKDNGYGSNYIICHNCVDTYEAASAALQEATDV